MRRLKPELDAFAMILFGTVILMFGICGLIFINL